MANGNNPLKPTEQHFPNNQATGAQNAVASDGTPVKTRLDQIPENKEVNTKLFNASDAGKIPSKQDAASVIDQNRNIDALKSGNDNHNQVTMQTKDGSQTFATQNDGKSTTYTDKNGNQYAGREGQNGQIELTPKDSSAKSISGQVTGRGGNAAFGNKAGGDQSQSDEKQVSSSASSQNAGGRAEVSTPDSTKDSGAAGKQQAYDSQASSRVEKSPASTEQSEAKTGQESFKPDSQVSQAKSDASSATTSPTKAGGDGSGAGSSQAFDQKPASGESHISNSTAASTSASQSDGAKSGASQDKQSFAPEKPQEIKPQTPATQDVRQESAGKTSGTTQAETRPEATAKNPGDATTKPGITDAQTTHGQNATTKVPDAVAAHESTLLPGKEGGAGAPGGAAAGGEKTGGAGGDRTGAIGGDRSPGGGTQGGSSIDNKAGDKPGGSTSQSAAPGDGKPGTAGDTTRTIKPSEPAEAPKATKAPEGATVTPGGKTDAGKVESTGERTTGQPTEKVQTPAEKTSGFPAVDMSQKDTRKDVLNTMNAIDGKKVESLPEKDQKFVASLEAMKKNEPDKYNQLKETLSKEFDSAGGIAKGDQASYIGKLNTMLGLDKTADAAKGSASDAAGLTLKGFATANRDALLGTAGNDALQKQAMVSLTAMLLEVNKQNALLATPGQQQNILRPQDVINALQNQSKQPGALDQLLSGNTAAQQGQRTDATTSASATRAASDAASASSQQGQGSQGGKGQGDSAALSPTGQGTGPGSGKPGDATGASGTGTGKASDGTATTSDSKTPLQDTKLGGKDDVTGKILKPDATGKAGDPAATKAGANQTQLTQKGPQTGKLDPNAPHDGTQPGKPGQPGGQHGVGQQGGDPRGEGMLLGDKGKKDQEEEKEEKQEEQPKKPEPEQRQRYVVQYGDTLESIAAKKLGNNGLAPLIYEINSNVISSWTKNGKRVIDLKPKLVIYLPTSVDIQEYNSRLFNSGQEFEYASGQFKTPEEELAMWESQIRGQVDGLRSEIVDKLGLHDPHSAGSVIAGNLSNLGEHGAEAAAAFKIRNPNVEKLLGPLKSSQAGDAGRSKYTVRLGDTLRSIALKHPLLQDVKLWKVLALANDLPTTTDNKGVPTTVIKRGMTLLIPTQEEIEEFRKTLGIGSNKTALSAKPATAPSTFDIVTKPCLECQSIVRDSDTICPKCGHSFAVIASEAPTLTKEPQAKKGATAEPVSDMPPTLTEVPGDTTGGDKRKAKGMRAIRARALAAGSDTETIVPPEGASIGRAKQVSDKPDKQPRIAASMPEVEPDTEEAGVPTAERKQVARADASSLLSALEVSSASTPREEDDEDPTTTILRAAGMLPTGEKKPLPPTLFEIKPSRPEKQDPGSAPTLFDVVPPLRSKANRQSDRQATPPDTSEAASANAFIKQMSESCRLVKSNEELYGLKEGDKLCLEINHESHWIPVVIYEIQDDASKRHEFRLDGKRRTTRIDLPPFAVRELADNDLASNWENYYSRYMAGKNLSD